MPAGKARPKIRYNQDVGETPAEVLEHILGRVLRARRMIYQRGNPVKARYAFERAHKRLPTLLQSLHETYDVTGDDIDRMMGTDFENFDEKLQELAGKMEAKEMEVMSRGDLVVSQGLVKMIRELIMDLRTLKRLLEGIEEGTMYIEGHKDE